MFFISNKITYNVLIFKRLFGLFKAKWDSDGLRGILPLIFFCPIFQLKSLSRDDVLTQDGGSRDFPANLYFKAIRLNQPKSDSP
jgi:hypothetical protein